MSTALTVFSRRRTSAARWLMQRDLIALHRDAGGYPQVVKTTEYVDAWEERDGVEWWNVTADPIAVSRDKARARGIEVSDGTPATVWVAQIARAGEFARIWLGDNEQIVIRAWGEVEAWEVDEMMRRHTARHASLAAAEEKIRVNGFLAVGNVKPLFPAEPETEILTLPEPGLTTRQLPGVPPGDEGYAAPLGGTTAGRQSPGARGGMGYSRTDTEE